MKTPSYGLAIQLQQNFVNLLRNLSAEEADRLNQRFDLVQAVARGELIRPPSTFMIWKTIALGGMSEAKLLKAIEEDGDEVLSWARKIMSKPGFTVAKERRSINLARAKVSELGFTEMPTTLELWKRIREIGELCPAEVGPQLRHQYKDQPKGEVLWVAMDPQIIDSDGYPGAFDVGRYDGGGRWLDGGYARPGRRWALVGELVFSLRK